jgi:hypothetical protein
MLPDHDTTRRFMEWWVPSPTRARRRQQLAKARTKGRNERTFNYSSKLCVTALHFGQMQAA